MFATPHMLTGAAVGRAVKRPLWLVAVLALLSHLVLDIVPHLDAHSLFGRAGGHVTPLEAVTATADFLLGVLLVWLLARRRRYGRPMMVGGLAGILIDLVDNVPPWSRWFQSTAFGGWLSSWHHGIQHNLGSDQWPLGLATQALVAGLAVLVAVRREKSQEQESAHSVLH